MCVLGICRLRGSVTWRIVKHFDLPSEEILGTFTAERYKMSIPDSHPK